MKLPRSTRFAASLALFAVPLAIAATSTSDISSLLKKPAPVADGVVAVLDKLEESSCTRCHEEITHEWATTTHALAWVSPSYQEELQGRKKAEACHGCHVPTPLHAHDLASKPDARNEARHFGVSCEACHQGAHGEMLGPTGAKTDAHESARSDTMVGAGSNELCSACHRTTVGPVIGLAKDFEQSELPAKGASCVGCHFAPKKSVDAADGSQRIVRSHELQTPRDPAFLALAFGYAVRIEGRKTIVEIENHAGHRVPGLIGREITFTAQAFDAGGKELAKQEFVLDTNSYLPLGEKVAIELEGHAAKVKLTGKHLDPRWKAPVAFVDSELKP